MAKNTDIFDRNFEDVTQVLLLPFNEIPEQANSLSAIDIKNKSKKTIELIEYYEKLKNLETQNKEDKFSEKKENKKINKKKYNKKRYYKKTK